MQRHGRILNHFRELRCSTLSAKLLYKFLQQSQRNSDQKKSKTKENMLDFFIIWKIEAGFLPIFHRLRGEKIYTACARNVRIPSMLFAFVTGCTITHFDTALAKSTHTNPLLWCWNFFTRRALPVTRQIKRVSRPKRLPFICILKYCKHCGTVYKGAVRKFILPGGIFIQ